MVLGKRYKNFLFYPALPATKIQKTFINYVCWWTKSSPEEGFVLTDAPLGLTLIGICVADRLKPEGCVICFKELFYFNMHFDVSGIVVKTMFKVGRNELFDEFNDFIIQIIQSNKKLKNTLFFFSFSYISIHVNVNNHCFN